VVTAARWSFLAAHAASIAWTWLLVAAAAHRPHPSMARQSMKGF
jgi:hypothetical protein